MGSAIARAFAGAGHALTVWNRSPERMQSFISTDIRCAIHVCDRIAASPVVVICVDDYAASNSILRTTEVQSAIRAKIILQFSTGTPQEAREAEAWADACGAGYLNGTILDYPREVGHDGLIFVSGKPDKFSASTTRYRVSWIES